MQRILVKTLFLVSLVSCAAERPPNIVFIIADDLGWNDVSIHGSKQVQTPNIDSLAVDGVVLDNYYTTSICSPSRAEFLTGRHTIHNGVYTAYVNDSKNGFLNTSYSLLPQYLKSCCGYSTHIVGKWHLGFNTHDTLPINRGFDTHLGYWFGLEDHVHHNIYGAYDFQEQADTALEYNNTFSTEVFTQRAVDIIANHSRGHSDTPFFLYLAYQDVHWPVQAPAEYVARFTNATEDKARQHVLAMAAHMDDGIGNVTRALKEYGLLESTLIVFTSDNGGPTNHIQFTNGNNFPLRGGKDTLWEGGNRVVSIVKGAGIKKTNYINHEKFYGTDWLPTLVTVAAGGQDWTSFMPANEPAFLDGDGLNLWSTLSLGVPSKRDHILLETHPTGSADRGHGDALIVGDWKLIKVVETTNNRKQDGWYPSPGEDMASTKFSVQCGEASYRTGSASKPLECVDFWCLFNLATDPCEYNNIAADHPEIVQQLKKQLEAFQQSAVEDGVYGVDPVIVDLSGGGKAWRPSDML